MTRCSVQLRERIFVKGYGFLSFTKNMGENISKKFNKNLSSKYSPKLLDHTEQSATDALKTASKERFKKQQKQLVISLEIKLLIRLQESQRIHHRIIQKQMKKKYREIYIPPELKHKIIDDLRLI